MRGLVFLAIVAGCSSAPRGPERAPAPPYLKGQLHVHTSDSGDSHTPPDEVARWYAARGYDFIVYTDHSFVTVAPAQVDGMLALPGVEITQNLTACTDPPGLDCLLHVNALITADTRSHEAGVPVWPEPPARAAAYGAALALAKQLGGVAQLNHPNFHWGADATVLAAAVAQGFVLFEVANQSSDVANEGDADHPSTEALWDAVLGGGGTLYGTATDDAHQYRDGEIAAMRARGEVPDTGDHGWVMVHATRDAAAIRAALARGDFYASTGVVLRRIERVGDTLVIEADGEDVDVRFIGKGGKEVGRGRGRVVTSPPLEPGGYVRADVVGAHGRAWVQPIR